MGFISFKSVSIAGLFSLIIRFVFRIYVPKIKHNYYNAIFREKMGKTNNLLRLQPSEYG